MIGVLVWIVFVAVTNRLIMFFFTNKGKDKKYAFNKAMPITIGLICGAFGYFVASEWGDGETEILWVIITTAAFFYGGWYNTKHYYLKGKF